MHFYVELKTRLKTLANCTSNMLDLMLNWLKNSAFNFYCEALIIDNALSRHPLTALTVTTLTHLMNFDDR